VYIVHRLNARFFIGYRSVLIRVLEALNQ